MKEFWLPKNECTGCSACADACPKKAVSMVTDNCGFWYPQISSDCIECNLCESVCKGRTADENTHEEKPDTYAAWSKDSDIRYYSTSGGVFSELAKVILSQGGVVAGAAYNENNLVEHIIINKTEDLEKIRQSKYIQSYTEGIYKTVREYLNNGKKVLFCGSPCQVAALYSFLRKKYDKLFTVDFICRGMNSPKAYSEWLKEIAEAEKSEVGRVWFKYKEGGWKSSPKRTRIDFKDGHYVVKEGKDNVFMHGYLTSNLYIRPCCGDCAFKGVPRKGDITVADFWGIDRSLDDDKGTSLVLVNSVNGNELFEYTKPSIEYKKRDFEEILAGNTCFNNSVTIPKKSYKFLKELGSRPFSKIVDKYTRISVVRRIIRKVRRMLK